MKIVQKGNFKGDLIQTILDNNNITDKNLLLNPTKENNTHPFDLHNMDKAVSVFLGHMKIRNEIGIVVDADVDGFTSATEVYQLIKKLDYNVKVHYFIHDNKAHGLTEQIMNDISKTKIDLLIMPDAGSNNLEEGKMLKHMGIDVIALDHHEFSEYEQDIIIVNNFHKDNKNTNENLVGAGITYRFINAIDEVLSTNYSDELVDLAAIGQIADSSDIVDNEIRYIVHKGLKNIQNKFIKTALKSLINKQQLENLTARDLSFTIIPTINAVARVGKPDENEILFKALNGINDAIIYTVKKKKKNKTTGKFDSFDVDMNIYEYAADICQKIRARQNAQVKKLMPILTENINNKHGVALGIIEEETNPSLTGLVASKLVQRYKKPVILVKMVTDKETEKVRFMGSCRGYEKTFESFKDWCNSTQLVEFAQGHGNAFGVSIFEEDFHAFSEKLKDVSQDNNNTHEVDIIVDGVNQDPIYEIEENKHLFGGSLKDPLLAYVNVNVNKTYIRQRGSMLTFFEKGVQFTFFDAPEGLYEELTQNFDAEVSMDFVGRSSINRWSNKETPQIILDACQKSKGEFSESEYDVTEDNIVF